MNPLVYQLNKDHTITKTRIHDWFDSEKLKTVYGIQVKTKQQKHKFYMHVVDSNSKRLAYENLEDAINMALKIESEYGEGTPS